LTFLVIYTFNTTCTMDLSDNSHISLHKPPLNLIELEDLLRIPLDESYNENEVSNDNMKSHMIGLPLYQNKQTHDDQTFDEEDLYVPLLDQSAVFGPSAESMWKSRKKRRKKSRKISKRSLEVLLPEFEQKLIDANSMYIQGDLNGSLNLLLEVLEVNPRLSSVYESIALIYEALGDDILNLKYLALTAIYRPKKEGVTMSSGLWAEIAKKANYVSTHTSMHGTTRP